MHKALFFIIAFAVVRSAAGSDHPEAEINNGQIRAKAYLPDAKQGFYRGTRFDWSGVIYSFETGGHNYYGPWFTKTDPTVSDFIYKDEDIVAGPCSAITGPVDEFAAIGWDEAKPGGTFIKIGIGALRKPAEGKYDHYHLYEVADGGKWTIRKHRSELEFTQVLKDAASGYAYVYRKTVRLAESKPEMVLEHSLRNTGTRPIRTNVYNHNFLVLDKQPPGDGFVITLPFDVHSERPPVRDLAEIRGRQIVYLKTLTGRDVVATPIAGFSNNPSDNQIRIENTRSGAGMSAQTNRPLLRESLWSIRSVIAVEPFVSIDIEPGAEFTWETTYGYFSAKH